MHSTTPTGIYYAIAVMIPTRAAGEMMSLLLFAGIAQGEESVAARAVLFSSNEVEVSWSTEAGRSYQVQSLADWSEEWTAYATEPAVMVAEGSLMTVRMPIESAIRFFRVVRLGTPPPSGMVVIPDGSFKMGDTLGDGWHDERPDHRAHLSAFYMDQCEVTKALWDEVYHWALDNDYRFDNQGTWSQDTHGTIFVSKGMDHPVWGVNRYDAVKWCNARSERDGQVPAYYTDAALTTVYRDGRINLENDRVKWDTGYRLPTEAEWEKAARGGAAGSRFPWSDTDEISHSRANYWGSEMFSYDTSTQEYHPLFAVDALPFTSPVGYFAPNGYELHDLAGNVREWCWDWYSTTYYSESPEVEPRGPASGSYRMTRGGYWQGMAGLCRSAARDYAYPDGAGYNLGFRTVLPVAQP